MSTLFVIGNGFDRAHGLKTSYWDFRKYLEKYAEDFLVQMENLYSIAPFERLDKRFKRIKTFKIAGMTLYIKHCGKILNMGLAKRMKQRCWTFLNQ